MGEISTINQLKAYYKQQTKEPCLKIFHEAYHLQQIILIRHGEPDLKRSGWYNRQMAQVYTNQYDRVGVKPFDSNPLCTDGLDQVKVYHSPLPRAEHTARLIFGSKAKLLADFRFREFEKKLIPFFNIHLPLRFWTGLSRLLWYAGLNSSDIERVSKAKKRTKENAAFLSKEASRYGIVVLVAHGFHNRYLSRYLKKQGWKAVRKGGIGHLAINILAKKNRDNAHQNPYSG